MPTLITHKKAHFDYEFLDTYEGGIELLGLEAKALRDKKGSLDGAHIIVRGGEAFMVNAHVPPLQPANAPKDYDPYRTRKLLLTKKQLGELATADSQKGLTIVPISLYTKGRYIKIEIAIARGKKKYDKREAIKKRDTQRDIDREIRNR